MIYPVYKWKHSAQMETRAIPALGCCEVQSDHNYAGSCGPDGARTKFQWTKRALVVLLMLAAAVLFQGVCYALQAPFFPLEAQLKGNTASQYGVVLGIGQCVTFLTAPIFGKLLSKYGRAKLMLCAGVLVNGAFCCLMSFLVLSPPGTTFFALALAIRITQHLGCSAVFTCSFATMCAEFPNHIEVVTPIFELSYGSGLILGPSIGGLLYEWGGFVLPFLAMGSLTVVFAIGAAIFFPHVEAPRADSMVTLKDLIDWRLLVDLTVVVSSSLSFGFNDSMLTAHLQQFHLTPSVIGLIFMVSGSSYAIACFVLGQASKCTVDPSRLCIIGSVAFLICFAIIGPLPFINIAPTILLICICQLLLGVGLGSHYICPFMHSTKRALVYKQLPNNLSTYSLLCGCYASAYSLGLFVGPLIGGVLLDNVGYSWATLFAFLLQAAVLAMLLLAIVCDKANLDDKGQRTAILTASGFQPNYCTDAGTVEASKR